MTHKALSLVVMGSLIIILLTALSFVTIGQSQPGPYWLWGSWFVGVAVAIALVWRAETSRRAWADLSMTGAVLSIALVLAILFVPISASAPYEAGADWQRAIDLTPPIVARLREAFASAYFAMALLAAAAIILGAISLLLHAPNLHKRPSH